MRCAFVITFLLCAASSVDPVFAADSTAQLSLPEAVAAALAKNPRLHEAQQRKHDRMADAIQATTLENRFFRLTGRVRSIRRRATASTSKLNNR